MEDVQKLTVQRLLIVISDVLLKTVSFDCTVGSTEKVMTCLDCSSLYKYGYGSQLREQLTERGKGDNWAHTYDVGASSNILLSTTSTHLKVD